MVAGISASAPHLAKHGFISQLYEVTALELTAPALTLNETATLQLSAWLALDDATFVAIPAANTTWSAIGPLSIAANGLATAGNVFQDTAATAQGSYGGFPATLGLTIANVTSDDFGIYAADGIADDWQVQYFGEGNVLAAEQRFTDFQRTFTVPQNIQADGIHAETTHGVLKIHLPKVSAQKPRQIAVKPS